MGILSSDWSFQTAIFTAIFLAVVFVSRRWKKSPAALSKEVSNELRGLAILGVVFAHLTYGKFIGTEFLFPLGIWGGIAVNLFFFLSGFGLATSSLRHRQPVFEFYKKRCARIYVPLWIFLAIILLADAFLLNRHYPLAEIITAFFGFFPRADLFSSIDAPLWFLTPLIFYYLVFPLIFRPRRPYLSSLMVLLVSFLAFCPLPVTEQISKYYQTHFLAFPLGILAAVASARPPLSSVYYPRLSRLFCWVRNSASWRWLAIIALASLAWQTAYHSLVGRGVLLEQLGALATMFCLVFLFLIKKTKFSFLEIFGFYSLEIYLWHWPLISRYDLLYRFLPPWLATILLLPLLLLVAYLFNRLIGLASKKILRFKKIPA